MQQIFKGVIVMCVAGGICDSPAFAGAGTDDGTKANEERLPIAYIVPPAKEPSHNAMGGKVDAFGYTISPSDATGSIAPAPAPETPAPGGGPKR